MPVTPLPPATDFTGAAVTQGQLKTALTQLIAYLSDHLGDTVIPSGPLSGFRNVIINGNFGINQRAYASGAAVGAGLYGHDRWKLAASGDTYTFSTTVNVTTVTIPAGKVLQQVIEGNNLQSGTYTLSWTGTAQGKIGAGSYGASGITGAATGGTNLTIEFGPGTVSKVQFEFGSTATPFEARPYGLELVLCKRYYRRMQMEQRFYAYGAGQTLTTTAHFDTPMRAVPTMVLVSAGSTLNASTASISAVNTNEAQSTLTSNAAGDCYVTVRVFETSGTEL